MTLYRMLGAMTGSLVVSTAVMAQQPPTGGALVATEPGKFAAAELVTVSAVVTAIDAQTRAVTLRGPQGNVFRVIAGPEVRNFPQVKVGDELLVTHAEALSLELKKGGAGIRTRVESDSSTRAAPGAKPGAAQVHEVTVTADVIAVNTRAQTVTLRGPQHTVDLRIKDPEQLKLIKVGDQVVARYTDAVAIAMQPGKGR